MRRGGIVVLHPALKTTLERRQKAQSGAHIISIPPKKAVGAILV
jgi:hypothetical protein